MNKISYHLGKTIAADWLIIVWVFVVLSAFFVGLAFYQFSIYRQDDRVSSRVAAATSTPSLLDHTKLDLVVKNIVEREQKFKALKSSPLRFTDPSK